LKNRLLIPWTILIQKCHIADETSSTSGERKPVIKQHFNIKVSNVQGNVAVGRKSAKIHSEPKGISCPVMFKEMHAL